MTEPVRPVLLLAMHPVVMDEILRADHVERLRRACRLPLVEPVRSFDGLGALGAQVEVLITSWGCPPVTADVLDRLPSLRLIAHLAGSVKGFIDGLAWGRGIQVTNAVAANAVPVAEYTVAAILFANKRVFQLRDFYRQHHENRAPWSKEAPNGGNYRKTVGLIGASAVGRKVIELLAPYDLARLVYDPYLDRDEARALGVESVDLPTLLGRSDVVSLHAPLLAETRQLLGAREFALMRDGATFINTARGAIVDQEALVRELVRGRINGVLDTTEPEVLPPESPLYRLPNVFLTPHIAGSLGSEVERLADHIVDEVERFVAGTGLRYGVPFEALPRLA
jgi:phosphoglycerate dehydrogenase-like enzyme